MKLRAASIALCLALAGTMGAMAQSVKVLGDFRDWSSYSASDGSGTLCFAMTEPKSVTPTPDGFSKAYLYITNRPAENISNEFNIVAGFSFLPDSTATINVGGQSFTLFTQNDAAWLDDAGQSAALASAIRAGSSLSVEGTSSAGIKITQAFSLSGATAASQAIGSGC